jgi:hypothetical protein
MDTRSYNIPADMKSTVEDQFVKLNKRATKLGIDLITWTWGKAFEEEEHLYLPIEISGPFSVSYEGWDFIATIQHLATGENIIRAIRDGLDIPKFYREVSSKNCDHCHVQRFRKDTYLLRHTDGNMVQVGSTCIKDFLGGNSPDNILQRANLVAEVFSFMDGLGDGFGATPNAVHIFRFLSQTVACINKFGWLSKSKADEVGKTPTAIIVWEHIFNTKSIKSPVVATDSDVEYAKTVLEWVENIPDSVTDDSEYLYNIRAIARSGIVDKRTNGYAASIVSAYQNYLNKQQAKTTSEYVGTIKQRQLFELTLSQYFSVYGSYGASHKYIFHDAIGNVLVWSASNDQKLNRGSKYLIKGTIKAHSLYKEVKQTHITRCEVVGRPSEEQV